MGCEASHPNSNEVMTGKSKRVFDKGYVVPQNKTMPAAVMKVSVDDRTRQVIVAVIQKDSVQELAICLDEWGTSC